MLSWLQSKLLQAVMRHAVTWGGAWLVSKGVVDNSQLSELGGAVMTLLAMGHSLWDKRQVIIDEVKKVWTTGSLVIVGLAVPVVFFTSGCSIERLKVSVYSPGAPIIGTNSVGLVQTNYSSPQLIREVTKRERLWLPDGYIVRSEDDMFGMKLEMTSQSSSLPNLIAGQHHGSMTWIPTSTNELYAPMMSVTGSLDNKAVPFWMSSKGGFTSGKMYTSQGTDTNGTSAVQSAIVPGTPTGQVK